jgi:hypothetical protein
MKKILLYVGGAISLLFAIFHLLFWQFCNWQEELPRLSPDNSGIMQMLNVASMYMMLFAAFISFYLAKKEAFGFTEKAVIVFIAGYYLLRIAFGLPFFGLSVDEVVIWVFCLIPAACYLVALRPKKD